MDEDICIRPYHGLWLEVKFCFISIMDANLRRYIESTDDAIVNGSPQHAALKYYQDKEDIDIEPNRFSIPYYLW